MEEKDQPLQSLAAGSPIGLEIEGLHIRLHAVLVGQRPRKYLITTVPRQAGTQPQAIYPMLYAGNKVTCFLLIRGTASAFKCFIVRFVMTPFPLLFLSFPEEVETVAVRRHPRVSCLFQGALHVDSVRIEGLITDLSLGGCAFICAAEAGREASLDEAACVLESRQLGCVGEEAVAAAVRSRLTREDRVLLGLQFTNVPDGVRKSLGHFLAEAVRLGQC